MSAESRVSLQHMTAIGSRGSAKKQRSVSDNRVDRSNASANA